MKEVHSLQLTFTIFSTLFIFLHNLRSVWPQYTQDLFLIDIGEAVTESYGIKHSCFRECGGEPMTCVYNFTVLSHTTMSLHCKKCPYNEEDCNAPGCVPGGGIPRPIISANQMIPGPSILVCENDSLSISVLNLAATSSISIHWHGIHQENTPYMDGAPYITQCPISPYGNFSYNFVASPSGTHMWHGHSGFQEADGLFGALIVRRKEEDKIRALYDYDLPEHTVVVWHWYDKPTQSILKTDYQLALPVYGFGLLVNGKASFRKFPIPENNERFISTPKEVFHVKKGKRYRFRMIFNSAIYCPLQISIDHHDMLMIASDGNMFQPVEADSFMITSGERFDFVLTANQTEACYVMRFRGFGDCLTSEKKVHEEAFICYDNASLPQSLYATYDEGYRHGKLLNPLEITTIDYSNNTLINLTDLTHNEKVVQNISGKPNVTLYIQVHSRNYDLTYPGSYHQFNNVTFSLPGITMLTERFQMTDNDVCTNETIKYHCIKDFCSCRYLNRISLNSLVEIVFVDITIDRFQDHPVHLHGYNFFIIASEAVGNNITMEGVKKMNEEGLLKKNLKNAIIKDSFSVQNKGYVVIRFIARNPGYWMLHCHVTNHMELGMAMILQVGSNEEMVPIPHNTPKCSNIFSISNGLRSNFAIIFFIAVFLRVF